MLSNLAVLGKVAGAVIVVGSLIVLGSFSVVAVWLIHGSDIEGTLVP